MKSLSKNPFFYLALFLALLVGLQVYGIVAAQTAPYTPPTQLPPGGQPARPIDTSATPQTKGSDLYVLGKVKATSSLGGVSLDGMSGALYFLNTQWLPAAGIQLRNGKLQYSNDLSSWLDIGTGTGGGFGWTQSTTNPADIYTTNLVGNVGIGVANPTAKLQVAGDVLVASGITTKNYYVLQPGQTKGYKAKDQDRMYCDGAIENPKIRCIFTEYETTDASGIVKFDNFEDVLGDSYYASYAFEKRAVSWAGKLSAADVDLSTPRWSGGSLERELNEGGGTELRIMDMWIDRWSTCPDGYFVTGVRFGIRDGKYLTPVVRCNKL